MSELIARGRVRHTVRLAAVVTVGTLTLLLAGCSGSSGKGGGTSNGASAANAANGAAASAASRLGLGPGGPLDVSKLCAAVPAADVQKLFKAAAPKVTANPGECDWGAGGITVDIYAGDADKKYYNSGAVVDGTAISGIGDVAQWAAPVPGATVPFLAAHKGTTTITVAPGLDVPETTMTYTGSDPFFKIPAASAQRYVQAEGQLVNDLFAAAG